MCKQRNLDGWKGLSPVHFSQVSLSLFVFPNPEKPACSLAVTGKTDFGCFSKRMHMVFIKLYKDKKKLINILSATLSELLILQSRTVEPA